MPLKIYYSGRGEVVLNEFVAPVLERAVRYDRATSFFDVNAFLAISNGIESLWRKGGRMRLIIGVHDVPDEFVKVAEKEGEWSTSIIRSLRERLLRQLSTIADELSRDRIGTLAWMMEDGLLEVRVAIPSRRDTTHWSHGIFHIKTFIFHDQNGNRIAATGSPNETVPGGSSNFESLTVHTSWKHGQEEYVDVQAKAYEDIWNGREEGLSSEKLDRTFATEVLRALRLKGRPKVPKMVEDDDLTGSLIEYGKRSPSLFMFNSGNISPYPHQERAVIEGLDRWPVRVMFSDEVGLGKTIEVGLVASYLIRFGGVRNAIVLAPKNLMRQWQEELWLKFQLEFWTYDSGSRSYISPGGRGIKLENGSGPLTAKRPPFVIISYQLARGGGDRGHIFEGATDFPDLLIVDEAHAARKRPTDDGEYRSTKMYDMLADITNEIPHVLFSTATPLQFHVEEYSSLLALLGIPEKWRDGANFDKSLELMTQRRAPTSLNEVKTALELTGSSINEYKMRSNVTGSVDGTDQISRLARTSNLDTDGCIEGRRSWEKLRLLLVRSHPAQILTIRNTRPMLEKYGYRFPERKISAPEVKVDEGVLDFYEGVDRYLDKAYGKVELAMHPRKKSFIGYAKVSYYQRLVSSMNAARLSLASRLARIREIERGQPSGDDPAMDELEEEEQLLASPRTVDGADQAGIRAAAQIERQHIEDLLAVLERVQSEEGYSDPKFKVALDIIARNFGEAKTLVFSRYTDTLDGFLAAFLMRFPPGKRPGHAMYTGQDSWIDRGGQRTVSSKEEIRKALDRGLIELVLCSDAASEGLNLQAAEMMINIDVPWNPARLEQRIGRIDRLGQRAASVQIFNLWYPNSIEADIYRRLIERRDLYRVAVGEAPEFVDEVIRNELASHFGDRDLARTDIVEDLQDIRRSIQYDAMSVVWSRDLSDHQVSTDLRQRFCEAFSEMFRKADLGSKRTDEAIVLSSENGLEVSVSHLPGRDDSFTMSHQVLDLIPQKSRHKRGVGNCDVLVLEHSGTPLSLCLRCGDNFYHVSNHKLPELILASRTDKDVSREHIRQASSTKEGKAALEILEMQGSDPFWLPDHSRISMIFPGPVPGIPERGEAELRFRKLGTVTVKPLSADRST